MGRGGNPLSALPGVKVVGGFRQVSVPRAPTAARSSVLAALLHDLGPPCDPL
jgi:hypothetical protein